MMKVGKVIFTRGREFIMVNVLFVCLGNICRSPMAEAVFRDLVKKEGLADKIHIDSAGTGHWHVGEPPHRGTLDILTKNNIDTSGLVARQIRKEDEETFDYIVVMDEANERDVRRIISANPKAEVRRLMDYVDYPVKNVPDPYYTGNFDEVYELITEGCRGLLQHIRKNESI
jgi:protein-tyrosine phosphatase